MIGVVIPCYNESNSILDLLHNLYFQYNENEIELFPRNKFKLFIVDNSSTDDSISKINSFKSRYTDLKVELLTELEKGVVSARKNGCNAASFDEQIDIIINLDVDTTLSRFFLHKVFKCYEENKFDVLALRGTFPISFWEKVPQLVKNYSENVGTLFFPLDFTIQNGLSSNKLISIDLFERFGCPVTDACFAISKKAYKKSGGYKKETSDSGSEIYFEAWRLLYNIQHQGAKTYYIDEDLFTTSPRRFLEEPELFLNGGSYINGMADYRTNDCDLYFRLNTLSSKFDYNNVLSHVIEYYILMPTLINVELIFKNNLYFKFIDQELEQLINNWWEVPHSGKEFLEFLQFLNLRYFERIKKNIHNL